MAHRTVPVKVWADVDVGIADMVAYLQTIPGVRTHASCQGTVGEGGPHPYPAHVMGSWTDEALVRLQTEYTVEPMGDHWGYLYPRSSSVSGSSLEPKGEAS